jgi:hypothetical protein
MSGKYKGWTGKFSDDHKKDVEWVDWRCWLPFLIATIIIGFLLVVLALWWGGTAFFKGNPQEHSTEYFASAFMHTGARLHKLSSAGVALQLTLLNDLSTYKGETHTIVSTTNQPHTVVIQAGVINSAWDKPGASLTATFGGAINDGFTFQVINESQIYIKSNTNVAFS